MTEHNLGYAFALKYQLGAVIEPYDMNDRRFHGSLAIPYQTKRGIKAIKFRRFWGDNKFDAPTGQQPRLYNTEAFFRNGEDYIALSEGEIDAIVATEFLNVPTLGIPGAETWRNKNDIWAPIFKDFKVVYVFQDGDEAGQKLSNAIVSTLKMKARIIACPENEDISSMVKAGRAQELLKGLNLARE